MKIAALLGAVAGLSYPRMMRKVFREKQPRPCLLCGEPHYHNNCFCSAEHCKEWRAKNRENHND